ncbi:MAG TPA: metalloregulator ArsR/SmtB family transcription factor [Trueperaceae bacterium]|nr:metalloregulator ArsR/SmtB family transcription factor [Trueperaceae bacterium]
MNEDGILSFSAPLVGRRRLVVTPAPVLELAYAYYFLMRRFGEGRDDDLPWVRQLRESPPAGFDTLKRAWSEPHLRSVGTELLLLACSLGYALDGTPQRFVADFPSLPDRALAGLQQLVDDSEHDSEEERDAKYEELEKRLRLLADPDVADTMQTALGTLWSYLEPTYEREGRAVSETAARALEAEVAATGDLLSALPEHHFVRFEGAAEAFRKAQEEGGRFVVVPLYFASQGGFHLDFGGVDYVGYGVHAESLFAKQQSDLADLAGKLKAFSDPTRLLLMVLIGRLSQFPLTVGDLAKQVGVSQPTTSGHLRMLKEMGLVDVAKKGNRSYYRLVEPAVKDVIAALQRSLVG